MPTIRYKLHQVFPKKGDVQDFRSDIENDDTVTTVLGIDSDGYVVTKTQTTTAPTWTSITGKPNSFLPSAHSHDDRYYTETEIDSLLSDLESLFNGYVETGVDYEVPTPVGIDGAIYTVKATATVDITVAGAGTIDGDATVTLYDGEALLLRSNGVEWMVS